MIQRLSLKAGNNWYRRQSCSSSFSWHSWSVYVGGRFRCKPGTGEVFMQPYKYFMNLIEMPIVLAVLLIGVVGVLFGIGKTIFSKTWRKGIWFAGAGTVLTVLALLLCAGWNNTAYYPSLADLQSSLTIQNSCSSPFTLKVMSYVSFSSHSY